MKNFNILTLAALAGAGSIVSSCQDGFLDENPQSDYTIESAYQTSDQVSATLASSLATLYGEFYGSKGTQRNIGSDISDGAFTFGGMFGHLGTWSETRDWNDENWDAWYKVIAYANQTIMAANLDNVSWTSEADRTEVIAEAQLLRGMGHLRLAEYYGAVPVVKEYSEELRLDYERTDAKEVYQFAIDQLLESYAKIQSKPEPGHPGKGACAQLLAEAFLALGVETGNASLYNNKSCYANAADYAQETIKLHPLMTKRFGMRADAGDTGSNLGVPNYNPDGSPFVDLFYKQNPRAAENTEAVWSMLGASGYNENLEYRYFSLFWYSSTLPFIQTLCFPSLSDQTKSGVKLWPNSTISDFYKGPSGQCSTPGLVPAGLPLAGLPSWYTQHIMYGDADNNGSSQCDDRNREGVAVRNKYPITNPDHPLYGVEQYYGTADGMIGWDDIDKFSEWTAMAFCGLFEKLTPIDNWGYDAADYYSSDRGAYRDAYMMRSADAYLLLAEARLRDGNATGAAEALNTVRERSNAVPFEASQITLQTILDERARELAFEEDRWATFLRMEPEVWKQRIYSYGQYTYWADKATLPGAGDLYPTGQQFSGNLTSEIKWNKWPIPRKYIDINTGNPEGMWQNEGWASE